MDIDMDDFWFEQDGATCHATNKPIHLLKETFGARIMSCRGPVGSNVVRFYATGLFFVGLCEVASLHR